MFCGTDNIPRNIPIFRLTVENIPWRIVIPTNNVMDLNNVMMSNNFMSNLWMDVKIHGSTNTK